MLMLMSNIRERVGSLGMSRVRDIAILGSTTSLTLCNGQKASKIVYIAAGEKKSGGLHAHINCGFAIRAPFHVPRVTSTMSCTGTIGRTLGGSKLTSHCSRTSVRTLRGKASPLTGIS